MEIPFKVKNLLALRQVDQIGNKTLLDIYKFDPEIFSRKINLNQISRFLRGSKQERFREQYQKKLENIDASFEKYASLGIKVCTLFDDNYPWLLREIFDAPILFFYKGNLEKIDWEKSISIVGTRKYSDYGKLLCEKYTDYLVAKKYTIVSGLAIGIDAIAHQKAVEADGICVGIVAHGLDFAYPAQNQRLYQSVLDKGGLLISEFEPGIMPLPEFFPMRNRIVAGLTKATLIVEAALGSGSLITANMAFEYNREVYAIPADLTRSQSMGCNEIIKKQIAKLTSHPEDIIQDFENSFRPIKPVAQPRNTSSKKQTESSTNFNPEIINKYEGDLKLVLETIFLSPKTNEEMLEIYPQFSTSTLSVALSELELEEIILKGQDGRWRMR